MHAQEAEVMDKVMQLSLKESETEKEKARHQELKD